MIVIIKQHICQAWTEGGWRVIGEDEDARGLEGGGGNVTVESQRNFITRSGPFEFTVVCACLDWSILASLNYGSSNLFPDYYIPAAR